MKHRTNISLQSTLFIYEKTHKYLNLFVLRWIRASRILNQWAYSSATEFTKMALRNLKVTIIFLPFKNNKNITFDDDAKNDYSFNFENIFTEQK